MADEGVGEAAHRVQDLLSMTDLVDGAINYLSPLEMTETGNDESIGQQRDASEEFVKGEINSEVLDYSKQQQQTLEPYNYSAPKNNGVLNLQAVNREKEMSTRNENSLWNCFEGCSGTTATREDDLAVADSLLLLQSAPRYTESLQQHFYTEIIPVSGNPMNEEENHAEISHEQLEHGSSTSIIPNSIQEVCGDYEKEELGESCKPLDVSDFHNESMNVTFSDSSQSRSHDSGLISASEGVYESTVSDISAVFSEVEVHTSNFEDSRASRDPNESEFREEDETSLNSSSSLHYERDANGVHMSSLDTVSDVHNGSGVSGSHIYCTTDESCGINGILEPPKFIEDNMISINSLPTVEHNSFIKMTNDSSAECNPTGEDNNAVKHNYEHIEDDEIPVDLSSRSRRNYHINPTVLSSGGCLLDISSIPASQVEQMSEVKPERLPREDYENNELQSLLQRLHCPFVWKPDVTVSQDPNFRAQDNIVDYLTEKEEEFRSARPNVFRRIVIRLVLSYEKAKAGRYQGAMKELEQCHQMLKEHDERFAKPDGGHQTEESKFTCDSTGSGDNENHLYQWGKSSEEDCFKECNMREDSHKEEEESAGITEMEVMDPTEEERSAGYWYVVVCSLAHVMALSGDVNRALRFAQGCIRMHDEFGSISQAAVMALHGAVFCEYGNEGNAVGLKFLKKAVELDPEYWQWNLNLGKVLGRLRRIYKSVTAKPDDEELQLLEKAVVLRPQEAATMVHLANVYRGLASAIYREANAQGGPAVGRPTSRRQHYQSHEDYRRSHMMPRHTVRCTASDDYLNRAKQLYIAALAKEPDCPYNNARCAKGLWSMPYPFRDKEAAQKAIIHALSIAPDDSLVNHYAGLFYEFNHDYDKALNCYERATADGKNNFPAHMSYVSLRMKINPGNYSPLLLLDYILRKYTSPNNRIHTLCARAFYHKSDKQPMLAIRYFRKAIEVDPNHFTLKNFHPPSVFGYCGFACNIYDVLREMLNDLKQGRDYLKYKSIIDETEMFLDSIQNHSTSS